MARSGAVQGADPAGVSITSPLVSLQLRLTLATPSLDLKSETDPRMHLPHAHGGAGTPECHDEFPRVKMLDW